MQDSLKGIRQRFTDLGHNWSNATQTKTRTFWIAIGAVVLALYLGFAQGGWVTGSASRQLAETAGQAAVVERLAPICVAQFNADSQGAVKLEELKALRSYQRANYVSEQGWATMPGETVSDRNVAAKCAEQLALIGE